MDRSRPTSRQLCDALDRQANRVVVWEIEGCLLSRFGSTVMLLRSDSEVLPNMELNSDDV